MNVKNPRLVLGLLALLAIIGIGGGFLLAKKQGDTFMSNLPITTNARPELSAQTVFDVNSWTEHKGTYHYEPKTPGSQYVKLVKGCNYSFRFPEELLRYEVGFGMSATTLPKEECDPILLMNRDENASSTLPSGIRFGYLPNAETGALKQDKMKEFLQLWDEAKTSSTITIVDKKRMYIDGRPAEQIIYDYVSQESSDPLWNKRSSMRTWIYDKAGVLSVEAYGYKNHEDLYQAIISTVRFR